MRGFQFSLQRTRIVARMGKLLLKRTEDDSSIAERAEEAMRATLILTYSLSVHFPKLDIKKQWEIHKKHEKRSTTLILPLVTIIANFKTYLFVSIFTP